MSGTSRVFVFICVCVLHFTAGFNQLCGNETQSTRSCTKILGHERADSKACQVEYMASNSTDCRSMNFGLITSNTKIGGVHLKPFLLPWSIDGFPVNYSVLNITFSNIKWKFMKFRFRHTKISNAYFHHCSSIKISKDITVDDQSVLYYDCYWPHHNINGKGLDMILEFEATNDRDVYRGEYKFYVPNASMLSTKLNETQWKPFIYIELFTHKMKLHIIPPSTTLNIKQYKVEVICETGENCNGVVKSKIVQLVNNSQDVTFEHSMIGSSGVFYFRVTPLHDKCNNKESSGCQHVESPKINITNETSNLTIGIVSTSSLVLAAVFVYFLVILYIKRIYHKRPGHKYMAPFDKESGPPKVLVIYAPTTQMHIRLTASFIEYIRTAYCMTVVYDGDIVNTPHKDPYKWAIDSFESATHILYIVGPNVKNPQAVHSYKDVHKVQLSLIEKNALIKNKKDISNIYFDYSNEDLPIQTKYENKYHLLKDWVKLMSHLTKGMTPVDIIKQTQKGMLFLEDLNEAKIFFGVKRRNGEKVLFDV